MRLVVVMKTDERTALPTAEELRRAGFAVSGAVGPAREGEPPQAPPEPRAEPGQEERCGEESGA